MNRRRLIAGAAAGALAAGMALLSAGPASAAYTAHEFRWADGTRVSVDAVVEYSNGYAALVPLRIVRQDDQNWYVHTQRAAFGPDHLASGRGLVGSQDSTGGGSHWRPVGTSLTVTVLDDNASTSQTWSFTS